MFWAEWTGKRVLELMTGCGWLNWEDRLGRFETVREKNIYCSTLLVGEYEQGSGIR